MAWPAPPCSILPTADSLWTTMGRSVTNPNDSARSRRPWPTNSSGSSAPGCYIGIATGRGKSVRRSLQEALPKDLWDRVVIGYYNGAEVGSLDDDQCPDDREEVGPELQQVAEGMRSDPFIARLASLTFRLKQITLTPADGVFPGPLWEYVHALLLSSSYTGAVALRSGHSVDIVTPETTKLTLVERVTLMAGGGRPVLRIGDRGRWPGNDFTLLDSAHSLSATRHLPIRAGHGISPRRVTEARRRRSGIYAE